jgi:predicted DsbA family dithiol-disulfide isomerase
MEQGDETFTLRDLAGECGLDAKGVEEALNGEDSLSWTRRDTAWAIQGVPFFFLLQKYGVSGAQPPDFWRDALPKTLRRRPPPRLDQEGR